MYNICGAYRPIDAMWLYHMDGMCTCTRHPRWKPSDYAIWNLYRIHMDTICIIYVGDILTPYRYTIWMVYALAPDTPYGNHLTMLYGIYIEATWIPHV